MASMSTGSQGLVPGHLRDGFAGRDHHLHSLSLELRADLAAMLWHETDPLSRAESHCPRPSIHLNAPYRSRGHMVAKKAGTGVRNKALYKRLRDLGVSTKEGACRWRAFGDGTRGKFRLPRLRARSRSALWDRFGCACRTGGTVVFQARAGVLP